MKRILCIINSMNAGGAETFLMKLYRSLNRNKYQMDFCVATNEKCFYDDEICSLGGKIFHIKAKTKNFFSFKKQLTKVVQENNYKTVLRISSNAAGFVDLKIAKKANGCVTIARSSNSSDGGGLISSVSHFLGKKMYLKYVDVKIAPSDLAAYYTFGEKATLKGDVVFLKNGIDLTKFKFDESLRKSVREELGVERNCFLLGHIGRFTKQKNHIFIIDVFAYYHSKHYNSKLLLIGVGELENEIRAKVDSLGLTNVVIFAGVRHDIPAILSSMDLMIFPSLYEGMPNVIIESQACGLPCIVSSTITKEIYITDLITFQNIDLPRKWAETIDDISKLDFDRSSYSKVLLENGYDISDVSTKFINCVFNLK